jgi:hypothetical protein
MTIALTNLRYSNGEQTNIELTVAYDIGRAFPYDGTPIPFNYVPSDDAPFTIAIKAELANGNYTIAPYVPPAAPQPPVQQQQTLVPGKSIVIAD